MAWNHLIIFYSLAARFCGSLRDLQERAADKQAAVAEILPAEDALRMEDTKSTVFEV